MAQAHPVEVVLVDVLQPRLVPHEQGAEKARLLLGVETVNLIHDGARQKGEAGAEGEPLRGQDGNLVPGLHLEEVALAGVVEGLLPLDAVGGGALGHGFDPVPRTQGEEVALPIKEGLDRFPAGLSGFQVEPGAVEGFLRPLEDLPLDGHGAGLQGLGRGPDHGPVDREPEQGNARPQQDPPGRGKLFQDPQEHPCSEGCQPHREDPCRPGQVHPQQRGPHHPCGHPPERHRWSDSPRM